MEPEVTDDEILSDAMEDLRKENEKLREKNRAAVYKVEKLERQVLFETILSTFLVFGVILAVVGATGFAVFKHVAAPEVPEVCTIVQIEQDCYCPKSPGPSNQLWELRGSIPWHHDKKYGVFHSFDDAAEIAAKIRCRVR